MTVAFQEGWCSLDIRPRWGQYGDRDTAALANKQVAQYVKRLWFAHDVTYDDQGIYVALTGKGRRQLVHLSKAELTKLKRTLKNKMSGVLFWAERQAAVRHLTKMYHPRMGAVAITLAINHSVAAVMQTAHEAGNDVIVVGGLVLASGGATSSWAHDDIGVAFQQMGMPLI